MCKYCEIDILSNEAKRNIKKNQRVTIKIVRNMLNENLYYLEIDTNNGHLWAKCEGCNMSIIQ